jgi:very-short-patch-repair endonuclease
MWAHEGHAPGTVKRARRLRSAMKPGEQKLWAELRKLDVHFRRQAPIGRYIADFACHAKKLVVEVDGEVHERLAEVALRDHERAEWLRGQGYKVVRFANREVDADISGVVEAVRRALALPLDGEGLGWGASTEPTPGSRVASAPDGALRPDAVPAPQSPTLSPSRGKGVSGAQTGMAAAPDRALRPEAVPAPQSPALSPSRGKGE